MRKYSLNGSHFFAITDLHRLSYVSDSLYISGLKHVARGPYVADVSTSKYCILYFKLWFQALLAQLWPAVTFFLFMRPASSFLFKMWPSHRFEFETPALHHHQRRAPKHNRQQFELNGCSMTVKGDKTMKSSVQPSEGLWHGKKSVYLKQIDDWANVLFWFHCLATEVLQFESFKPSCDKRFQCDFSACVFKVITLVWDNQSNFFENATPCSKRMLKTCVTTSL